MSDLSVNWEAFLGHLKILLEQADMVPAGLATALHISRSAVSQWFSGRTRPALETVGEIVEILQSVEILREKRVFQTPLELLDWTELIGWEPEEERLRAWFGKWFKEHSTLPRGPVLGDQRHLLRRAERLVGREKELGQVREWLTAAARFRRPAAKVVVIGGMAGVGKTALAQAVGRDPMVERYFRDGVLWAQLGPKPDIERWLREWANLLGMPSDVVRGSAAWLWQYLAPEERRALVILDDVWPGTPFERLMVGGPQCRVLITSQVTTVANLCEKVRRLRLSVLGRNPALELARWTLERKPTDDDLGELEEVVKLVGELPLAVRVAVAAMRDVGVARVLEGFRPRGEESQWLAEPGRVERLVVPGAEPRQSSVPAAFRVGYEMLEEADQRRFRALGNLARAISFGVEVLAALWGDEVEKAREAARRLVERSLLERVGERRYSMHGLLHDFAAGLLKAAGERDTEGAWVDRFQGGLLKGGRWWWPCVPRPLGGAQPFSRAWLVQGWEELRTTTFRRYWDLIRDRWKGEGVPAEVWATGLWLHRRRRRHLRLGWRIVGGITVACLMLGGLLAVLDLGLGMRIVLGHMLYEWLSWLVGIVLAVYGASILPMLWIIGIDLINFHRLYHLPVSSYDAAAGERDEEIAKQ